MEAPDQLLARLDKMGEPRVRGLLAKDYFEPKTISLVQGWISRKERERTGPQRTPEQERDEALRQALALAQEASEAAARAHELARKADELTRRTHRLATVAVAAASVSSLVSILALLVLAIR
jgi:hypothetical protein